MTVQLCLHVLVDVDYTHTAEESMCMCQMPPRGPHKIYFFHKIVALAILHISQGTRWPATLKLSRLSWGSPCGTEICNWRSLNLEEKKVINETYVTEIRGLSMIIATLCIILHVKVI